MSLFIRQNDNRTELQKRLAAELQERTKQKTAATDLPDGVTDSAYMKDTTSTTRAVVIWIVIGLIVVGGVVWLTIASMKG